MEPEKLEICKNRDNDILLPRPVGNGMYVVGYVNEVSGAGAAEVAGYAPTCHEIIELVKYWHRRVLDNSWFFFIYGGTGGSEARLKAFARRRIARAEAAIGEDAVDAAIKDSREEFRTKVVKDDRLWDIFENGTHEQRAAVQDRFWEDVFEKDAADRRRSPL